MSMKLIAYIGYADHRQKVKRIISTQPTGKPEIGHI